MNVSCKDTTLFQKIVRERTAFRQVRRGTPVLVPSNQNSQHEDGSERRPSTNLLNLPLSNSNQDVSGDGNSTSNSNRVPSKMSLE